MGPGGEIADGDRAGAHEVTTVERVPPSCSVVRLRLWRVPFIIMRTVCAVDGRSVTEENGEFSQV